MSTKAEKMRARAKLLRVGPAARLLGIHPDTLRDWERAGKLPCIRVGVRNERRFTRSDLEQLLHTDSPRRAALYLRVSGSRGQETSLENQEKELRGALQNVGITEFKVFKDCGSGLNEKRRGLARLRAAAARGDIDQVWVTHEDRLTRFGLDFLRAELEGHGANINVLHEREDASAEQELVDDFMKLLACFSGRVYGQRSAAARKRLLEKVNAR